MESQSRGRCLGNDKIRVRIHPNSRRSIFADVPDEFFDSFAKQLDLLIRYVDAKLHIHIYEHLGATSSIDDSSIGETSVRYSSDCTLLRDAKVALADKSKCNTRARQWPRHFITYLHL